MNGEKYSIVDDDYLRALVPTSKEIVWQIVGCFSCGVVLANLVVLLARVANRGTAISLAVGLLGSAIGIPLWVGARRVRTEYLRKHRYTL